MIVIIGSGIGFFRLAFTDTFASHFSLLVFEIIELQVGSFRPAFPNF